MFQQEHVQQLKHWSSIIQEIMQYTAICVTSKTSHGNYNKQNVFAMSLLHVVHKDFVGVVHGWVLKFLETEQ